MSRLYVVAYDVADSRRRRAVLRICRNYLQSAEYSMLEGRLLVKERNELVVDLQEIIDPSTDKVKIYGLALRDSSRRETFGDIGACNDLPDYILL